MAEIVEDRVKETTTSEGVGTIALGGAAVGHRSFASVCVVGDTFYGCIVGIFPSGGFTGEWEIGYYTYSATNTITRTRVDSSSNNDALVSFSAGTKHIFIELTAAQIKVINSVTSTNPAAMPTGPDPALYTAMSFEADFSGTVLAPEKFNTKIWYDADNATKNFSVANGALNIWSQKDATSVFFNRTIDTDGKYFQRYGFFEIEAMLPVGYGLLPAFWVLNHDAAARPEMTIMKAFPGGANNGASEWGNTQNQATNYLGMVYDGATILGTPKLATTVGPSGDMHTKFHKYGMHWSSTQVIHYFDGQAIGPAINVTNNVELQKRMYMILSLWTGSFSGDWNAVPSGVAPPSDGDQANAFKINYLRTWRLNGVPVQSDETPPMTVTDPADPTPGTDATLIVYHGDSTVWGTDGAVSGGVRVARPVDITFQANLPSAPVYRTVNEGVSGNTWKKILDGTDGVHPAWTTWLTTGTGKDAKYIICNCAINDATSGQTTAQVTTTFNTMVDAAVAEGKTLILETPNETTNDGTINPYRTALVTAAQAKNVAIIDQWTYLNGYRAANSLSVTQLCPDGTHPNQSTYDLKGVRAAQRFVEITTGSPSPSPSPAPIRLAPSATNYLWVSTTGSDSNAGTEAAPFRTILKAAQVVNASTVVRVKPGTYAQSFQSTRSGTASGRITFFSETLYGARIVPSGTSDMIWDNRGNYVTIDGFEVDGNGSTSARNGIYNGGSNCVIQYNHVHHIATTSGMCSSQGGSGINGDSFYGGINSTITGNKVHHIGSTGCSFIHGIYLSTTGRVDNNLVYQIGSTGVHGWHDMRSALIINNTIFACDYGVIVGGGDFYNTSGPADNVHVHNNIIRGVRIGVSEQGSTGPSNTYKKNLMFGNTTNFDLDTGKTHTGTVTSDPLFISWLSDGTGNYKLQSTSPAIGVADNTYIPALDFDGYSRPQGSASDLGCFEFVSSATPSPDPAPAPAPTPSPSRAIQGPSASLFGTTPRFFDDFDGSTINSRWTNGKFGSSNPAATWRIRNSCLEFAADPNTAFTGGNTYNYSIFHTENSFNQKFGFWQVECKLPIGKGWWPSFWLFGNPSGARPEIDVFEAYPGGPFDWSSTDRAPHPTRCDVSIHPLNDSGSNQATAVNFNLGIRDYSSKFFTFGLLWDSDRMDFYVDGVLIRSVTNSDTMSWFSQYSLHTLLQFGINYGVSGGPSSDPTISPTGFGSDPSNPPPNVLRFNYVSVWQFLKYGG